MAKAPTIDRLKLTAKKFGWLDGMDKVPAAKGIEDLPPEPEVKGDVCPMCGGELIRWEGCFRCTKCGWSKC